MKCARAGLSGWHEGEILMDGEIVVLVNENRREEESGRREEYRLRRAEINMKIGGYSWKV